MNKKILGKYYYAFKAGADAEPEDQGFTFLVVITDEDRIISQMQLPDDIPEDETIPMLWLNMQDLLKYKLPDQTACDFLSVIESIYDLGIKSGRVEMLEEYMEEMEKQFYFESFDNP